MRPATFDVTHRPDAAGVTVAVGGELDMQTVADLQRVLEEFLVATIEELTLDLQEVTFMDSTALKLMIELSEQADAESWRLRLIAPRRDSAMLVLRITGADKLLPFEPGAED